MKRRAIYLVAAVFAAARAQAEGVPATPTVLANAPRTESADFVRKRQPEPVEEFSVEEARLKQALAAAADAERTQAAARLLAEFYMRYGLDVEALAAMKAVESADAEACVLIASAEYSLGRFSDAAHTLDQDECRSNARCVALEGMALARLGSFERADVAFETAGGPPGREYASEYQILRAAAALAVGKTKVAALALERAGPLEPGSALRREAAFYETKLQERRGARDAVKTMWVTLARADDAVGARAALKVLEGGVDSGAISTAAALEQARALSLRWRGGETEREALYFIGALAGETPDAFAALRLLAERHPDADLARAARNRLSEKMARLADDGAGMTAAGKARLFYEMADYAPPGAEGDALIRTVASRLRTLDLLGEAAELLEHQVFKRLRGVERATVASDLAALYLDDGKPAEALRVIASTRIAGLDEKTTRRRLTLEATALLREGDAGRALALLDGASGVERLRGDIFWMEKDWPHAAEAYRAALAAADAPFAADERDVAVRAATAYLLAEDEKGFSGFRSEMSARIGSGAVAQLFDALADEAKTIDAMSAYRKLYARQNESS